MTAGQVAASQEVTRRLDKHSYQFQKKGNKAQFLFNASVKDAMEMAKAELLKVMPTVTEEQQLMIKKGVMELNKGSKAIVTRLKHIKIADCSELEWGVVAAYESDKLADDSEDEKSCSRPKRRLRGDSKRGRGNRIP